MATMVDNSYSVFFCGTLYYTGTREAANKVKNFLSKKYPKVDVEVCNAEQTNLRMKQMFPWMK